MEENLAPVEGINLIVRYYDGIRLACSLVGSASQNRVFSPPFTLPDLDDQWRAYFSIGTARYHELGRHQGHQLHLLDLMNNPGTQTTKTFASLLMVARAVQYIHQTGEGIIIMTPSSGNKAVALRDAVERALAMKLVTPDQLCIVTLIPWQSKHKLRGSTLTREEGLRRSNPIFVYDGDDPHHVKAIVQSFIATYGRELSLRTGAQIWYSLDLDNYKVADAARAFFELEFFPSASGSHRRLQAQAVSSAFGLLGYQFGLEILAHKAGLVRPEALAPGYLLVQQGRTCDMVTHLLYGSFSRNARPTYQLDQEAGVYRQRRDPHFPFATWNVDEILDSTFYTIEPPTAIEMSRLIERHGGSGIVVSKYECIQWMEAIRALLGKAGLELPAESTGLCEWSLVMAFTGVFLAIERGLLDGFDDVVIHGSGLYGVADYEPVCESYFIRITSPHEMKEALL